MDGSMSNAGTHSLSNCVGEVAEEHKEDQTAHRYFPFGV